MKTSCHEVVHPAYSAAEVCAIVVTYNPDANLLDRINAIALQCHYLLVVDNGSKVNSKTTLIRVQKSIKNCSFLYNTNNVGIAAAMNLGIEKGMRLGYQVFCTFDQDTRVHPNYVVEQLDILNHYDSQRTIVGCNYFDTNRNRPRYSEYHFVGQSCREVKTVITSGMMFSASCRRIIGEFNSTYFIDSVDHEYCLRARKLQCVVYLNSTVLMAHSIGELTSRAGTNRAYLPYSHNAERKYYAVRNTLWTIRQYGLNEPGWALKQLGRIILEFTCLCLFENNRASKIRYFLRGVRHALNRIPKHNPT